MNTRITLRADTTANWTSANPVLAAKEMVFDTDRQDFKVGDGVRSFVLLPYLMAGKVVFRGLFTPDNYLQGQYVEGPDGSAYMARRTMFAQAQPTSGANWRKTSWGQVVNGGGPAQTGATLTEWEPKIYDAAGGLVVVLYNFTMYQLTATLPYESDDIELETDLGDWTPICCETNDPVDPALYLLTEDGRRISDESGKYITVD